MADKLMRDFSPYDAYKEYEDLVQAIDPAAFVRYLAVNGWRPLQTKREGVAIYQYFHEDELEQADIPFNREFRDYGWALYRAVRETAYHENRPIMQVFQTLLNLNADILMIRRANPCMEASGVPLPTVVRFYSSLERLLAASIWDVQPRSRPDTVRNLIRHCHVAQTKAGSDMVFLACPFLDEDGNPYTPQTVWDHTDDCVRSLTRRAMRHLIEGIHALETITYKTPLSEMPVSADFCDAASNLCGLGTGDLVDLQVQWSPAVRENVPTISAVRLSGDFADQWRDVAKAMERAGW